MLLDNSRLTWNPVLPSFTLESYARAAYGAIAKEGVRLQFSGHAGR